MQKEKKEYLIFLLSNDVKTVNQLLLYSLSSKIVEKVPDFKVIFNKKRIQISFSANQDALDFVLLITKVVECKIVLVPKEKALYFQEHDIKLEYGNEENTVTFEELEKFVTNSKYKKSSKVKMIIDYILTLNDFSTKDLKNHFPNMTNKTLYNAIYIAKSRGIISSTNKGVYIVNQN